MSDLIQKVETEYAKSRLKQLEDRHQWNERRVRAQQEFEMEMARTQRRHFMWLVVVSIAGCFTGCFIGRLIVAMLLK